MSAQAADLSWGVSVATLLAASRVFSFVADAVYAGKQYLWPAPRTRTAQAPDSPAKSGRLAATALLAYGAFSLLLWHLYQRGMWTAESVGFTRRASPLMGVIVGLLVSIALLGAYRAINGSFNLSELSRSTSEPLEPSLASKLEMGGVFAIVCLLGPTLAEIFYRGLLVHQMALLSHDFRHAIVVGAIVNTVIHASRGWRAAPYYLLVYACTIGLLYSPYGLAAAIAFHYVSAALSLVVRRSTKALSPTSA